MVVEVEVESFVVVEVPVVDVFDWVFFEVLLEAVGFGGPDAFFGGALIVTLEAGCDDVGAGEEGAGVEGAGVNGAGVEAKLRFDQPPSASKKSELYRFLGVGAVSGIASLLEDVVVVFEVVVPVACGLVEVARTVVLLFSAVLVVVVFVGTFLELDGTFCGFLAIPVGFFCVVDDDAFAGAFVFAGAVESTAPDSACSALFCLAAAAALRDL